VFAPPIVEPSARLDALFSASQAKRLRPDVFPQKLWSGLWIIM
jgi:hypothetical protein